MIPPDLPSAGPPAGADSPLPLALSRDGAAVPAFLACVPASRAADVEERRAEFLHESELRACDALRFEKRRHEFLLGRYAAKAALGAFLGERAWNAIEVLPGIFQQPLVRHEGPLLPAVCITHSAGAAAAVAFPAAHPLAIDLERVDGARLEVLRTQVGAGEAETEGLSAGETLRRVTQLWTAKEALSKVLRCGLTCPVEVLATEGAAFRGGEGTGLFRNFGQYRFESVLAGRFAFSIVLPRNSSLGPGVASWLAGRLGGE